MVDIMNMQKRDQSDSHAEFLWLVLKKMTREAVHVCDKGLSQ